MNNRIKCYNCGQSVEKKYIRQIDWQDFCSRSELKPKPHFVDVCNRCYDKLIIELQHPIYHKIKNGQRTIKSKFKSIKERFKS